MSRSSVTDHGRPAACVALALMAILATFVCAQAHAGQMLRVIERGPVGYLHGETLMQRVGDLTAGDFAHPAVADWSGDGRKDVVAGSGYGDLLLFSRPDDGPCSPAGALLTDDTVGLSARPRRSRVSPWLGDLDGDGELNLLLGIDDRVFSYRVQDGSTTDARTLVSPATHPDLSAPLAPVAADLTGDGTLATLIVDGEGRVSRVDASGATALTAGGARLQVTPPARAWAGDWDGSGFTDLLIGTGEGSVLLYRGGPEGFQEPETLLPAADAPDIEAAPWATDWDGDGRVDLLVGWRGGFISLFKRQDDGTLSDLGLLQQHDAPIDAGRCAVATAGDWTGNGLTDIVVGGEDGRVMLYQRIPGEQMLFERGQRIAAREGIIEAEGSGYFRYAAPVLVDFNLNGRPDLLVGSATGRIIHWENAAGMRRVGPLQVSDTDLRMTGIAFPAPFDYDRDSELDLFVGARPVPYREPEPGLMLPEIPSGCVYFENIANRPGATPEFEKGVPIAMTLVSIDGELRRDASFLTPYAAYPVQWSSPRTLDFLVVTLKGTFLFENVVRRGEYARLEAMSEGRGLPTRLLPPLYSAVPAEIDGKPGILAADTAYGFVTWYER